MRGSLIRRMQRGIARRLPPPAPPDIHATGETPDEYRCRLIKELLAENPAAKAAYEQIAGLGNAVDHPVHRLAFIADEARLLTTYTMVPDGPGRLLHSNDYLLAPALASLKGWQIEDASALGINYESERLPYEDNSFDGVLLCEVIEHFNSDPLFCLIELNRVLRHRGFILVTTPNAASWFSIYQALQHLQPNQFAMYGASDDLRMNFIHSREYTSPELEILLDASGFGDFEITTRDLGIAPPYRPIPGFDPNNRNQNIFCLAYKRGRPRMRYVAPIYFEDRPFDG